MSRRQSVAAPSRGSSLVGVTLFLVGILVIAAAIAFDDAHLTQYQLDLLDVGAKVLGGLAILFGAFRYLDERAQRLAWDKTRFIAELFQAFDNADDCQRARRLIDNAYHTGNFDQLTKLLGNRPDLTDEEWRDRDAVDRFLDFFDRLFTYVYITATLSPDDVSSFSGYVIQIRDNDALSRFALSWGYEDVLEFADRFDERANERVALVDRWRERINPRSP